MKPRYEVGSLLRKQESYIASARFNGWQQRTLFALGKCRTQALGGHIDKCNHTACGKLHLSYNSCRNRHCPKCQGHKKKQWVDKRLEDLLPIGYYHVVFTLPSELHALCMHRPRIVYGTLFKTAWEVIRGFGENPKYLGAKTAMIAVLHTWGQNLSLHPHLHCIVPSGGITKNGKWKSAVKKEKFLFPVKSMSNVFRAKFVAHLRKQGIKDKVLLDALFKKEWVVYSKKPFASPETVIQYLGRYTHKVAISNHRIVHADANQVIFKAKNYKKRGKKERISLDPKEFIRRFSLHILPKRFVRLRHYGFLSSTGKRLYLAALKKELGAVELKHKIKQDKHLRCPKCKKGVLITVCEFGTRGPPKQWIKALQKQIKIKK